MSGSGMESQAAAEKAASGGNGLSELAMAGVGYSALRSGTRIDGRYVIDTVLAAGGFGITYLVRHEALDRMYAIKEHFPREYAFRHTATATIYPSHNEAYAWALDRFVKEAQALARCKHPNVVNVSDVFEANGTAYMVLDYEDGQSLKHWLQELGRAPTQAEIDGWLMPLLDALEHVHAQGLLHRDIAPDNIMIRRNGSPCLIDFGSARQAIAERSQFMSAIVKASYSPPEQYTTTGRSQGPWSDIYALAGTVYRAITGDLPQEAPSRTLVDEMMPLAKKLDGRPDYRAGFVAAIDHALAIRPDARPQSVAAWRRELLDAGAAAGANEATTPVVAPALAETKHGGAVTNKSWQRIKAAMTGIKLPRVQPVALGLALLAFAGAGLLAANYWPTADGSSVGGSSGGVTRVEVQQRIANASTAVELADIERLNPALKGEIARRRVEIAAAEDKARQTEETRKRAEEAAKVAALPVDATPVDAKPERERPQILPPVAAEPNVADAAGDAIAAPTPTPAALPPLALLPLLPDSTRAKPKVQTKAAGKPAASLPEAKAATPKVVKTAIAAPAKLGAPPKAAPPPPKPTPAVVKPTPPKPATETKKAYTPPPAPKPQAQKASTSGSSGGSSGSNSSDNGNRRQWRAPGSAFTDNRGRSCTRYWNQPGRVCN